MSSNAFGKWCAACATLQLHNRDDQELFLAERTQMIFDGECCCADRKICGHMANAWETIFRPEYQEIPNDPF